MTQEIITQISETVGTEVFGIWFLIGADDGITISSDLGEYDYSNSNLSENIHEHADAIVLRNTADERRKVKFIQVILLQ